MTKKANRDLYSILSPACGGDSGLQVVKDTWKEQRLYCEPVWMLSLFMKDFIWTRASAFWTAKSHHSGRPHWRPLNALFCACLAHCSPARPRPAFECLIQIWGHRMRKKASPLRPLGTSTRVNKQAGGTLLPSGADDSSSKKEGRATKAAFKCWCRRFPGDASRLYIDHQYLVPLQCIREAFRSETACFYLLKIHQKKKRLFSALMGQRVVVLCATSQQTSRGMIKHLYCLRDAAGKVN